MTLAGIEARFKSRRGLVALWLVATAGAAATALLMWHGGVPGWDDAAHVYKVFLLRHGQSIFWDNFWYGGGYGAINYGFVFYLLALFVPAKVIAVVAAGALPPLFYLYQRDMWKIDDIWPAWFLALVMSLYLAHGQDPFLLGLALTMGGLVLLARSRPVLAALLVALGIFANPLAFVVAGVFMLADVLARPELRPRYVIFFVAVAPFVAVRVLFGVVFAEPGAYLNETTQLLLYLGFALAGIGLAGVNAVHARRPFFVLFVTYAALCLGSFVTPGSPLGNNIGRFFMVFGLSLFFLLRHSRLRRPYPSGDLAMVAVVLFAILQLSTSYSHFTRQDEWPQTHKAFFSPALATASQLYDPNYRLHVVALRRHWEAAYFPEAGFAITRGWYRQADAIHNRLFYQNYNTENYVTWLRHMGVEYVFLPDAPLDVWSAHEATILKASRAFSEVRRTGHWTIYRLRSPEPLAVGLKGGTARVLSMGHREFKVAVDRPGMYLVKVTWSPYWVVGGGPGRLSLGPDRFIYLQARAPGTYTVRFHVTLAKTLSVAAGRVGL